MNDNKMTFIPVKGGTAVRYPSTNGGIKEVELHEVPKKEKRFLAWSEVLFDAKPNKYVRFVIEAKPGRNHEG